MSIDVATFADAVIVAADQSDGHALAQLFAVDSIVAANLGPNLHHLPVSANSRSAFGETGGG
jgi:predicted metallopeptidase